MGKRALKGRKGGAWFQRLSTKRQQWIWFIGLWLLGFLAITLLSLFIRSLLFLK